jgi:RimJ/RimL family protein N-acetyltransferase
VNVRHVVASEAGRLREIRLASLAADPHAFGGTYDGDAAKPASWWEWWAEQSTKGHEQRTFVVVDGEDRWLGIALVRADDDAPGEAVLNAMWVAPEARRHGAARALCDACAAWAAQHAFRALNAAVVVGNDAARRAYEAAGFAFSHATTWTGDGRTLEELILTRAL